MLKGVRYKIEIFWL